MLNDSVRAVRGSRRARALGALGAGLAMTAVLTGCGSGDSSSAAPTTDAATTSAVAAPARSSENPAPIPAVTPASAAPAASSAPAVPTQVPMPNVMCMNLQAAQDLIQEQGVFFSRSADATGQGRRQVVDANWVVVGQTPAAGALIGEGEAVLSVVKIGEPSPC